jgi:5-methylcytosine-specific restriction endonuclease McrA
MEQQHNIPQSSSRQLPSATSKNGFSKHPDAVRSRSRREYLRKYQSKWAIMRRREWITQNGPCVKCGSDDRLEVDHVNPEEKQFNPRVLWSMSPQNPLRIAELNKCQVLCHECHKAKTRPFLRLKGLAQEHSNRTGYRGVTLERSGRYRARVYVAPRERITLGWFDDPAIAGEVVRQFLIEQGAEYAAGRTA